MGYSLVVTLIQIIKVFNTRFKINSLNVCKKKFKSRKVKIKFKDLWMTFCEMFRP